MTTTIEDGGPAFPCSNEQFTHGNPNAGDAWSGLSLRDYFAGQALAGMAARDIEVHWSDLAARAYVAADASADCPRIHPGGTVMNALPQLDAPKIHICSTLYRPNAVSPIHTVLIDGEIYTNVNRYLLAALQEGMTPAELEMEPSEEEEDFE